ncbi:LPXTG cell wall anchor domain-containing protein [Glycomyces salinus]|uniref:LPXTG cell wall anchor domain-containing protein n=1 Tax=Glycomyces salinus TaxID=980294 RepID=UPI0018EBDC8D|nr:LPXTG cell wall anchor domain-containing protein [Glycomyces salinus]
MSTLKSNALRAAATFGIAAGFLAASAGTAQAQHIVANADIGIPENIAPGANTILVSLTPTGDETVQNPFVSLTPDNYNILDFNPGEDERCTDDGGSQVVCTIDGPLPAEGATFEIEVAVPEDANEETDLGFSLAFYADDVEPATAHTGLILGSTALDPDNEPPSSGGGGGDDLPIGEEPTETPDEESTDEESEPETTDDAQTDDNADEQLPTTGADSGILIGAAGAVAVFGIGALLLARRRRTGNSWS